MEIPRNPGEIKSTPNQPEAKFTESSAKDLTKDSRKESLIISSISPKAEKINGVWKKVIYLSKGEEIAVANKEALRMFIDKNTQAYQEGNNQNLTDNDWQNKIAHHLLTTNQPVYQSKPLDSKFTNNINTFPLSV